MRVFISIFFLVASLEASELCRQSEGQKNCLLDKGENNVTVTQLNLLGNNLKPCSFDPITGFTRSGYCEFVPSDRGRHLVCASVTKNFLAYTASQGNDLSSPNSRYGFKGLRPGDRWCLCSSRVKQAIDAGVDLTVIKEATHAKAWAP